MLSRITIGVYTFVCIYLIFNTQRYKDNIYQWDVSGYYIYLPAIFIHHDVGRMDVYKATNEKYRLSGTVSDYGFFEQPTGKRTNKYTLGCAVLQLPFFLIAHAYCHLSAAYTPDGYTYPYQFAGIFSGILWTAIGLLFLRGFLRQYFPDITVAITLLCIALGTNIYCYTTYSPGMSHPYSFFLSAAILYYTHKLYSNTHQRHFFMIGILLGMVIIIRPVNIIIAVLPLFWAVHNISSLRQRLHFFSQNLAPIAISFLLYFAVASLQMAYWYHTTGHFIHYSYTGEGFNFLQPHIGKGLWGFRKGWFIYTPIAFIALCGLYFLWKQNKKTAPAIIVYLAVMIYVVFSWQCWWYGGGFSARALIETLPIVAFPLAHLCHQVYTTPTYLLTKVSFSILLVFCVTLNLFQTYQHSFNTIHCDRMTRTYYFRTFGKIMATDEDLKYLMTDKQFKDEYNFKK